MFKHPHPADAAPDDSSFNLLSEILFVQATTIIANYYTIDMFQSLERDSVCSSVADAGASIASREFQSLERDSVCSSSSSPALNPIGALVSIS